MTSGDVPKRNRGVAGNPANRFEKITYEPVPDWFDEDERPVLTEFFRDEAQSILTRNSSPDVPFKVSLNPYRGCEHGCVYCYARPTHEYLGFSSGIDFETRIMVKEDAPELLQRELSSPKWKPETIALSAVTDAYQTVERKLGLTRRCLEVLAECRNPVGIVTKNALVTRDIDLLLLLARHHAVAVFLSLTTMHNELRKKLEPRTSPPSARLRAIRELDAAGIPVGVLVAPVIPAINDHELPAIIAAAAEAGARFAGYVTLRLPHGVAPMFKDWLDCHFSQRREKVINQIRSLRRGKLNDPSYGSRMRGEGIHADRIARMFEIACLRAGLRGFPIELSSASFRRPTGNQLTLFD